MPSESSAALMWTMLSQTLLKGSNASRPMLAKAGLSTSLIDPAISFLKTNKSTIQFSYAAAGVLEKKANKLEKIIFNNKTILLLEKQTELFSRYHQKRVSRLMPGYNYSQKEQTPLLMFTFY